MRLAFDIIHGGGDGAREKGLEAKGRGISLVIDVRWLCRSCWQPPLRPARNAIGSQTSGDISLPSSLFSFFPYSSPFSHIIRQKREEEAEAEEATVRRLWNFIHASRPFLLDEKRKRKKKQTNFYQLVALLWWWLFVSCCVAPFSRCLSSRLKQTNKQTQDAHKNRTTQSRRRCAEGVSNLPNVWAYCDFWADSIGNWRARKLNIPPPSFGSWPVVFGPFDFFGKGNKIKIKRFHRVGSIQWFLKKIFFLISFLGY